MADHFYLLLTHNSALPSGIAICLKSTLLSKFLGKTFTLIHAELRYSLPKYCIYKPRRPLMLG